MEKQLLILGNGFDLHCDLKSKYEHFYKNEIKGKYKEIDYNMPSNFWHILLNKLDNQIDYNWCDIEKIILDVLQSVFLGKSNSAIFNKSDLFNLALENVIEDNNNHYFNKFIDKNYNTPTYFVANYCYNYLHSISDVNKRNVNDTNWQLCKRVKFVDHLFDELKKLEKLFCAYIKKQINDRYFINAINIINNLTNKKVTLNTGFVLNGDINQKPVMSCRISDSNDLRECILNFKDINILNFNYTFPFLSTHEKKEIGNISNVHDFNCRTSYDYPR